MSSTEQAPMVPQDELHQQQIGMALETAVVAGQAQVEQFAQESGALPAVPVAETEQFPDRIQDSNKAAFVGNAVKVKINSLGFYKDQALKELSDNRPEAAQGIIRNVHSTRKEIDTDIKNISDAYDQVHNLQ